MHPYSRIHKKNRHQQHQKQQKST